jgi:hypothetical protein
VHHGGHGLGQTWQHLPTWGKVGLLGALALVLFLIVKRARGGQNQTDGLEFFPTPQADTTQSMGIPGIGATVGGLGAGSAGVGGGGDTPQTTTSSSQQQPSVFVFLQQPPDGSVTTVPTTTTPAPATTQKPPVPHAMPPSGGKTPPASHEAARPPAARTAAVASPASRQLGKQVQTTAQAELNKVFGSPRSGTSHPATTKTAAKAAATSASTHAAGGTQQKANTAVTHAATPAQKTPPKKTTRPASPAHVAGGGSQLRRVV